MQDRYVGDFGDFTKYGLLTHLVRQSTVTKLGVVWYLVPNESHNGDGQSVEYLLPENADRFEVCDSILYSRLRRLIMSGERRVSQVRAFGLFPLGTIFFESVLIPGQALRAAWHAQALAATVPCDVVFLDPDNGLVDAGAPSRKHTSLSEVADYYQRGQSVVSIHHPGRHATHAQQIDVLVNSIRSRLPGCDPIILKTMKGTPRWYVVMPSRSGAPSMATAADAFCKSAWSSIFQRVV